ncbi:ketose-bisphosphate aldolase [Sulfuricella denitrificans skB26]|uniref:Ketose-bisphosphate aldolase n=1 Tax=Sulfuricella denitrificans (strain DSM 22764 / NBRC 105220 / skB26) TaxID=1163617 RepID=S6AM63_SULDS|nr:ketose-bisphosphate aldolase [Sulfuricella denitrificans]BAN35849.1 ketose-bisphosphate aldolase [Sulfuricella denitrificans skB26]
MPLIHLTDMLNHAYRHNYAVGAFGVVNLDFLEGVMQAAENCRAPVIINLIESHFTHYDFELLMPAVLTAARRAKVPVAIYLDHGSSIESAKRGIRAGCNGVMVDTSQLPLDENLKLTREVAALAHACGVGVEGELGYVPGNAEDEEENDLDGLTYTLPAEAKAMVKRTGIDCLAVSIGTVHGRKKGSPKLDFTRLAKLQEAAGIPLVIHGGTGLSDEQYRKLIAHGVTKINYYTALSEVAANSINANAGPDRKSYKMVTHSVRSAIREEVERCIRIWGSSGRAAEVMAQCRPWREVERIMMYNQPESMSEEAATAMMRQGKETLSAIPGVRLVQTGTSANGEKYRRCWLVRLATPEAAASFNSHPDQLKFANSLSQYGATDRTAMDFELSD